jgi:hypothetical protein
VHALSAEEHRAHQAATERLLPLVTGVRELPRGYALRLAPSALADATTWGADEQTRCPFLTIAVRADPSTQAVWLEAVGQAAGKRFLRDNLVAELLVRRVPWLTP